MRRAFRIFLFFCFLSVTGFSQPVIRKVLFLGNSYTFVNDLPQLVAGLAQSAGDSLYTASNTPGGYTLGWQPIAHRTNPVSLAKIREEDWDFVVLQEQSQIPAIPALRDSCMYPACIALHDTIKSYHPCSRVLFFLTWARQYGGIQCFEPNYCSTDFSDFDQMQDSITNACKGIADSLNDWIAPAGEAWRYVMHNSNMVLHMSDQSHPNLNGSYLAACVFYACIFGKSPVGLPFTAGLLPDTALFLQQAADTTVFYNASFWNLWTDQPVALFTATVNTDTLFTDNQCSKAHLWHWDFGDGNISTEFEPVHVYASTGNYNILLTACDSCRCDTASYEVSINVSGIAGHKPSSSILLYQTEMTEVLRTFNYNGNGLLILYDIKGEKICSARIISGRAKVPALPAGLYCWLISLENGHQEQGKICLKEK